MDRVDYAPLLVQEALNLHKADELNLNPWYQRRAVWTRPQKAYLINTLFERKPIPSLYIRHSLDLVQEKSIKEVVDGQQRLRSIIEYANNEFAARHPDHKQLTKYADLTPEERTKFKMTPLSAGYLVDASDPDVIEIFGRLNSVAKNLNAQEKRNAKFSGEWKQYCLREAANRVGFWRDYKIFTANDIARMNEVQFTAELAIALLNGVGDYSVSTINNHYTKYDESFTQQHDIAKRFELVFAKLLDVEMEAVTDTIFSRSPIFYSLFVVLDSVKAKVAKSRLEDVLYSIDERFNSDKPLQERPKRDAEFAIAASSNVGRIRARKVRDTYIRRELGIS